MSTCYYHIHDLLCICLYLPLSIAKKSIATALDYCNSLFCSIVIKQIAKLQRVQNCLARVVTRYRRFIHAVPFLKSLHCLPVRYRIIFKVCGHFHVSSIVFSIFVYSYSKLIRSSSCDLYFVREVNTTVVTRTFAVDARTLWNMLPSSSVNQLNILLNSAVI